MSEITQRRRNDEVRQKGKQWLKRETAPFRASVVFLTVLSVSTTIMTVAFAYLVQYLINGAAERNRQTIIVFSTVLICLLLARVLLQTLSSYYAEKVRAKITVRLRNRLFERALYADYSSLEQYHSGDLLNRFTSDVNEVVADTVSFYPAVVGLVVQAVTAVASLISLDPLFTGILVGGALLSGGFIALCRKSLKRAQKETVEADGKSRSFIQESTGSVVAIKAYGVEERTTEKSAGILRDYYKKRMARNRLRTGMHGVFSLLGGLSTIFALIWCSLSILNNEGGDFGSMFSVVLLLGQLQRPITAFSSIMPTVYAREASAERLAEIDFLPSESENTDTGNTYQMHAIRAENLSFSYTNGGQVVYQNASLTIPLGKNVCITGESGSGKSTLFKLLLGVYHANQGSFYVDVIQDGEAKSIPLSVDARKYFAYVPQGNFLFSGTIRENLTFFAPEGQDVSEEVLYSALETACATFVNELPNGVDTVLHERGGGLSEGQIQRLAVARALLSQRKILLLDEATSALDGETEKSLLANLIRAGKSCIIVTHRPAALEIADKIFRVQNGKIEEVD